MIIGGFIIRIYLSNRNQGEADNNFRNISDDDGRLALLFNSMVEAKTPNEFRKLTIAIQHKLRNSNRPDELSVECPHPKWFDSVDVLKVDDTICRFCGYRFNCSRFDNSNQEYVDVISLDQSPLPPKSLLESCFSGVDKFGNSKKFDPFLGFSMQAESTRNLYMISARNFKKYAENKSIYNKIETTVGYDVKYQQPIWTFDQIMLTELHKGNNLMMLEKMLISSPFNNIGTVLINSDKSRLNKIATELKWCDKDSTKSDFEALYLIVNRIGYSLLTISSSEWIVNQPFLPRVDFPHNHGCSSILNLVLRFLHFHSDLLRKYIQSPQRQSKDEPFLRSQNKVSKKIISEISFAYRPISADENARRYLPRFPIIAFSSFGKMSDLELDFAAGRIIEVVDFKCDESLLLIDGLGINIDLYGPWAQC
jgi:hypothetical protein